MKKGISILLLFVFFLFQGGRMLLYLECRFSNSITTSSCDCTQILTDTKPGGINDVIPVSNHANHKHLPEEFESLTIALTNLAIAVDASAFCTHINSTTADFISDIFHPPLSIA